MREVMLGRGALILVACGIVAVRTNAQSPQVTPVLSPASPPATMMVDFSATKIARAASWLPAGLTTPHTQALFNPPVIRFRNGRVTLSDRAVARSTHAEIAPSPGLLTLDITRIRRAAIEDRQTSGLRRDRSSMLSMAAGYAMPIDADDSVRLTATIGKEKHKTLIAIADGRSTGTSTKAIGAGWRHGGIALDVGWFGVRAFRSPTAIDRAISLAAGSAIAEQGYQASASAPLSLLSDRRARIGLHFVNALVDQPERRALGTIGARDMRMTLALGIRLR